MYELTRMTLGDMTMCGAAMRQLRTGASSMEEASNRLVRHLYENFTAAGKRSTVLVRAYKTHDVGSMPAELAAFARAAAGGRDLPPKTKCLTLLATAGDEAGWNDRRASRAHQAIPLTSAEAVDKLPMVAQLVGQLGLDVGAVLEPDPALILDLQQKTFNVFYVPVAEGSPHIPAQSDFVKKYGVQSVIGFGTVLPNGDLFAIIVFARVPIGRETAELFKPLALAAKLAVLPFSEGPIFDG